MAQQEWLEHDYYADLGVADSASDDEISKAYKKLARKYHPDANPDDETAEEKFKKVSSAYDVIGDPERRKEYDQIRRFGAMGGGNGFGPGGAGGGFNVNLGDLGDLGDVLSGFFGGGGAGEPRMGFRRSAGPMKGRDVEARLTVSFDDAVNGTTTQIYLGDEPMKVRIPAGVNDGQTIRLRGKGTPGSNGGPRGDAYIHVDVEPHPVFGRKGKHLTLDLPVTYPELALGADIKVPTYSHGPVTVRVAPGTPNGRTLRVKGKGISTNGTAGDLLVTVQLEVPTKLSKKERAALEELRDAMTESPRAHLEVNAK